METPQPIVTFVVPSYNAADYLERSVRSILAAPGDFEVLIVDDGSQDDTLALARRLAEQDGRVRVIAQSNANWGGVVNHAISLARGAYFKIVDADDHVDPEAVGQVLARLTEQRDLGELPDLVVTNYVYDRVSDQSQHTISYRGYFPEGRVAAWGDLGRPNTDQIIMVHASWFRTELLRDVALVQLPEGISYTDSLLVLQSVPYVRTVLYLDLDVYYYLIGRVGQSVDVEMVVKNIDQQLYVTERAIELVDYEELHKKEPRQAQVMLRYLSCMMSICTIYLFMDGSPGAIEKNRQIWARMRQISPWLTRKISWTKAGLANRHTRAGRWTAVQVYGIVQNIFKFA